MRRGPAGKRPSRVAELLREALATILLTKCADPRLLDLTLTDVEMTPDLKQARVYYVVRQGADEALVLAALDKALGFIRSEIARARMLRTMPEFHFLPDDSLDRAARVEALFQEIGKGETGRD
jgi:ribosome-binding factor A